MKKVIFLALFFVFAANSAQAQSDRFKKKDQAQEQIKPPTKNPVVTKPPTIWDKLIYGGGAGFGFGTNTNIFLAPQVGYLITDDFAAGVGYMYNYARWTRISTPNGWQDADFTNQIHGPNVFANLGIWETLFVGTQIEYLNHDYYRYNLLSGSFDIQNTWTPVWFLQGGFMQKVGRKGQMLLGMRINLLHDIDSPYSTSWAPILQVYF